MEEDEGDLVKVKIIQLSPRAKLIAL